jgi:hypothetical protein
MIIKYVKNKSKHNIKKNIKNLMSKWGKVTHVCNPSFRGGIGRRIKVRGQLLAKIQDLI